ncbi:HAD-IA family hydrolase [Aureimonas fodinaquatilis]|uniref:HAD-IA family hydrolase n=1 Tax=Aureimonas fodinaquatilis TaxID=2565783 RepID=A0A5B0E0B3_9HYPH|nr:HAD-IA family hydrolase [Aureimonas fodinaquatilis]KAA0972497.1 HAD-IA family hydrolase [Aureimonas fodinaquatilis]
MALSLIIFDCDGVLVDSEIVASEIESEKFAELGYEISPEEISQRFAGLTLVRIVEILGEEAGLRVPENFVADVEKESDIRLAKVAAIAGVHDMLDRLDLPRCICSNSMMFRLELMLRHVDLWNRFRPYIYPSREVGTKRGKPAPDVFLYACREFGVAPENAIVLEDSVHGVAAAAAAGCRVVGFTGGRHTHVGHADSLTDAGAETVIHRLSDFPAVVEAFSDWEKA